MYEYKKESVIIYLADPAFLCNAEKATKLFYIYFPLRIKTTEK